MARNSRSEADDGNAEYGMMSMGGMVLLSRFIHIFPRECLMPYREDSGILLTATGASSGDVNSLCGVVSTLSFSSLESGCGAAYSEIDRVWQSQPKDCGGI